MLCLYIKKESVGL